MVESHLIPGVGRTVAGVALLAGLDMAAMHACCRDAVVTGRAETDGIDARVVETCVAPVIGRVVAGIALFGCLDMGGVFTGCADTVMAG